MHATTCRKNKRTRFLARSLRPQTGAPAPNNRLYRSAQLLTPSDMRAKPIPAIFSGARYIRNAYLILISIHHVICKSFIYPLPMFYTSGTLIPPQTLPPNIAQRLPSATTAATYIQRLCRNFSMLDICATFTSLQLSATINTRHFYSAKTLPHTIFVTAAAPHTTQRLFSLTTCKNYLPLQKLIIACTNTQQRTLIISTKPSNTPKSTFSDRSTIKRATRSKQSQTFGRQLFM